jgi:hypothetical protein
VGVGTHKEQIRIMQVLIMHEHMVTHDSTLAGAATAQDGVRDCSS